MALERRVLHLDVADFPVAVARVVTPGLRGFPVAIAPPVTRALVLALSPEARKEGVVRGMALSEALKRCPDLRVLSPDEGLERRAAAAVREVASAFTPVVEAAAHGRLYLDATGTDRLFGPAVDLAARLRGDLRARLRLDAALGIAVNKLVSRVAADLTEPAGLLPVPAGDEEGFLAPLPVVRLPGVGLALARELSALNLRLVGQVAAVGPGPLVRVLGPAGGILHQRARGIDPRPVRPRPEEDEIRKEAALAEDTNDPAALRRRVQALAGEVARELRARGRTASRLRLELRHADARGASAGARLATPADLDPVLARAAEGLLDRALTRRIRVRSLVLRASGLGQGRIASLFDEPARDEARAAALAAALDRIRARFGDGAIRPAAA